MKVEMEGGLQCFMLLSLCEILEVVSAEAKVVVHWSFVQ